jgi:hypothetical protein
VLYVSAPWRTDNLPASELLDIGRVVADVQAGGAQAHLIPQVDDIVDAAVNELRAGDLFVTLSGSAFGDLPRRVLARLRETSEQRAP